MLLALASFATMAIALFCLVKAQFLERKTGPVKLGNAGGLIIVAVADLSLSVLSFRVAITRVPQPLYELYVAVIPELPAQLVVGIFSFL